MTPEDALEEAEKQGIDLAALEIGESVTFYAESKERASQQVTVTKGAGYITGKRNLYHYSSERWKSTCQSMLLRNKSQR